MRDKIKDGGQAFPVPGLSNLPNGNYIRPEFGMTLRDYFIAHAPAEPQPWFVPVMPSAPQYPEIPQEPHIDLDFMAGRSNFDRADEASRRAAVVRIKADKDFRDACLAWEVEEAKQRYIQWPAAWADEMLKAREVK